MYGMFALCTRLVSLNISNFNTSNVTNMGRMFESCQKITSLDLSNFNTEKVTNMNEMFSFCTKLTLLNVSSFNTTNVTDMGDMFAGCRALPSLDLSNFNTANVTNMYNMFYNCFALPSLDLSNFNTEKVTDMRSMFSVCFALTTIYCNNTWTCEESTDMFVACRKLVGVAAYDKNKVDVGMANPETGYFTKKSPAGISAAPASTDVVATGIYTLQGVRLVGKLENLPAGVYIVDGRKMVKK